MQQRLRIIFIYSLITIAFTASGQKLINSPYSRFNLGSMEPAGSFRSAGMGGIGISLRDNNAIFNSNPASYSGFDTVSFIFDFGIDYGMNFISDGVSDFSSDDMNFDHLLMGFPISRGWGFAFGILPVSSGYYKMSERVLAGDPGYDPLTGEYSAYHAGDGGFNNFFMGTGMNITKNLSAGINMSILFGQLRRINQFDFADYYNVYNNNSTEKLQIGGTNLDFGLQYRRNMKNDYFVTAGMAFTGGKNYNTKYEHIAFKFNAYSTKDTISYISDETSKTYIPNSLKFGLSFGKKDKFTAGVDYITTLWSSAIIPGSSGYSADTKTFMFGAEYIPERYSNYSFFRRAEYRIGAHAGNSYLIINGEQVKEVGASIGLGVPMSRSYSKTNLFFDFTRRSGSVANGLHTENYYLMGASLNLYDLWFRKRKYD